VTRHFCYEGDVCAECAPAKPCPPVDVSWVTLTEVPEPISWPWWLAVPAAAIRRWFQ
jgi:hypothetical protein